MSETQLFSAGETLDEIGNVVDFYRAALSLKPGQVGPIVSAPGALYLMETAQRIEPVIPPLEDVKDRITETSPGGKRASWLGRRVKTFWQRSRKRRIWPRWRRPVDSPWEDTGLFPRRQAEIPEIGILPLPLGRLTVSKEKPVVETAYLQDDTVYVMVLRKTIEADPAGLAKEKEALTRQIGEEKRQRAFRRLIENLKANAEIEIHPEFI